MRHVCDRIAVMYLGKIVELADADALFEHPRHPVHRRAAQRRPGPRPAAREGQAAPGARRRRAVADEPAAGVPLPHPLPEGEGGVCNVEEPLLEPKDGGNLAACHFPLTDQEIAQPRPDRGGVSAVDRVAAALARAGVDAEIREYPEGARTAQDAAAAVGCEVGQICKSLVFRVGDDAAARASPAARTGSTRRASAPVEGGRRLRARADRLRDRRRSARSPTPARWTRSSTRTCCAYDVVWAAAGTPRAVFPIAPGALVAVSGGRVARVRPD